MPCTKSWNCPFLEWPVHGRRWPGSGPIDPAYDFHNPDTADADEGRALVLREKGNESRSLQNHMPGNTSLTHSHRPHQDTINVYPTHPLTAAIQHHLNLRSYVVSTSALYMAKGPYQCCPVLFSTSCTTTEESLPATAHSPPLSELRHTMLCYTNCCFTVASSSHHR